MKLLANTSHFAIADYCEQLTVDYDLYGSWQLQGFPLYQHFSSKDEGPVHSAMLLELRCMTILLWHGKTEDT